MKNDIFDITLSRQEVYETLFEKFRQYIPFDSAAVIWFDPFLRILVVQHSYNIKKADLIYLKEKLLEINAPADFILSQKIQYSVPAAKHAAFDIMEGMPFITSIPLVSKNEAIGLLLFYSSKEYKQPQDLIAIDELIETAIIVVKNHIYAMLKDEIYVLTTTLFDISQNTSLDLSTADVMWSILDFLKITFNVHEVKLYLYREREFELLTDRGFKAPTLSEGIKNFFFSIDTYYYKEDNNKLYLALFDVKKFFGILEMSGVVNSPTLFNTLLGIRGAIVAALKNCRLYDFAYRSAMYDYVSSLYTRHYFNIRFAEEVRRAERYSTFLSIIHIDIDDFNHIREMYSEEVCNNILRKFGTLLKENLRSTDFIARFGWDEFVIILPNTDIEGAMIAAKRIKTVVENTIFNNFKLSVSIGLANFPFDGHSDKELLDIAKAGVEKAKLEGGNTIGYSGKVPLA